jgi:hypothetical protein
VILYLPPGPVFQNRDAKKAAGEAGLGGQDGGCWKSKLYSEQHAELSPQHILAASTLSTVVTVTYRLGNDTTSLSEGKATPTELRGMFHKYPIPVHDTLAGLDWIMQHLKPPKLCIFGEHVGGSLALMLALTEVRVVYAIAALEPICDWIGLDEYCIIPPEIKTATSAGGSSGRVNQTQVEEARKKARQRETRSLAAPPDLVPLLKARETFFATPEKYFDAFASPILFLQSPGKDCPKTFPRYLTGPEYPIPMLTRSSILDDPVSSWDVCTPQEADVGYQRSSDHAEPICSRRVMHWPPYGLNYDSSRMHVGIRRSEVTLPWVRIFARRGQREAEGGSSNYSSANDQGSDHYSSLDTDSMVRDQNEAQGLRGERSTSYRPSHTENDSVITRQCREMVSVMRRACFWGREKGFGESRVALILLSPFQIANDPATKLDFTVTSDMPTRVSCDRSLAVEAQAGKWFRDLLEGECYS